jgi:hypothetical protein
MSDETTQPTMSEIDEQPAVHTFETPAVAPVVEPQGEAEERAVVEPEPAAPETEHELEQRKWHEQGFIGGNA